MVMIQKHQQGYYFKVGYINALGMWKPHYGNKDFFFRIDLFTLYLVIIKKTLGNGNSPFMNPITEMGL